MSPTLESEALMALQAIQTAESHADMLESRLDLLDGKLDALLASLEGSGSGSGDDNHITEDGRVEVAAKSREHDPTHHEQEQQQQQQIKGGYEEDERRREMTQASRDLHLSSEQERTRLRQEEDAILDMMG